MNADDDREGTMRSERIVPFRMRLFIALLLAAVTAFVAGSWTPATIASVPAINVVSLFLLLVAAERLMMRFRYRGHIDGITLFEAALAPALVTMPVPLLVVVVALAQAVAGVIGRDPPVKAAFNVAQWSVAAALGGLAFDALATGTRPSASNMLAVLVAITVVLVTNIAIFTYGMHLVQREPIRRVLSGFSSVVPVWGITWVVNLCFAIIFTASYSWSAVSVPVFFVPLVLMHLGSRGYAAVVADKERLTGMHRATRTLVRPVDPREAIPAFLAEVRTCFQAEAVDLVLATPAGRTVHRNARTDPPYTTYDEPTGRGTIASLLLRIGQTIRLTAKNGRDGGTGLLRREGWRSVIAAPVADADHTLGVLCVYDSGGMEGFEGGETVVLEALAVEIGRAMIKSSLLETILGERHKLSEIVGRASDGILTLSPSGAILTWNSALERITGYAAHEMVATMRLDDLAFHDANGNKLRPAAWAEDAEPLSSDVRVTTKFGETRWLSCSYTRVADSDSRPSMLIVVARDTTEAREVERLKDDFVATVSHELRTPLTPIKGWASTMLQIGDQLDDAQREEGMKTILRHAERLEQLITNILEVTRIERGLLDRRDARVDVGSVVEKVVTDFRVTHPGRTIRLVVAGHALSTQGDELWTEQIVTNLVSNALKYSPAREPVEVRVVRVEGRIEVSVVDRGPGIPPQETERIFERFKRLGDHMTRTTGGSGLGLYIARQLANAIGARLTVQSPPGGGATFSLSLPALQSPAAVSVAS